MFRRIPNRISIDLYQPEIVHYVCAVVIIANVRLGNNLVPLIAMPPPFVIYAQGRELCPKKQPVTLCLKPIMFIICR